jgi:hypothetical protein
MTRGDSTCGRGRISIPPRMPALSGVSRLHPDGGQAASVQAIRWTDHPQNCLSLALVILGWTQSA